MQDANAGLMVRQDVGQAPVGLRRFIRVAAVEQHALHVRTMQRLHSVRKGKGVKAHARVAAVFALLAGALTRFLEQFSSH